MIANYQLSLSPSFYPLVYPPACAVVVSFFVGFAYLLSLTFSIQARPAGRRGKEGGGGTAQRAAEGRAGRRTAGGPLPCQTRAGAAPGRAHPRAALAAPPLNTPPSANSPPLSPHQQDPANLFSPESETGGGYAAAQVRPHPQPQQRRATATLPARGATAARGTQRSIVTMIAPLVGLPARLSLAGPLP